VIVGQGTGAGIANVARLSPASKQQMVYELIRERIVEGAYLPGGQPAVADCASGSVVTWRRAQIVLLAA